MQTVTTQTYKLSAADSVGPFVQLQQRRKDPFAGIVQMYFYVYVLC